MGNLIVGSVAVDYLRVTSRRDIIQEGLFKVWEYHYNSKGAKRVNIMQFSGIAIDGGFIGEHYNDNGVMKYGMLQSSGYTSHLICSDIVKAGITELRCTRIDLQLTIPLSIIGRYWLRLVSHRDKMKDVTGKVLQYVFIENASGLHTLYLGSRKSDTYRRIYLKEYEGELHVRFECELKGDVSRLSFGLISDITSLETLWLRAFKFLRHSGFKGLYRLLGGFLGANEAITLKDNEKDIVNLKWVNTVVVPYLKKVCDTYPDDFQFILEKLHNYYLAGNTDTVRDYRLGKIK